MALIYSERLLNRLKRLQEDVAVLKTVSVLGFAESDSHLVEENVDTVLLALAGEAVDLRSRRASSQEWPWKHWFQKETFTVLVKNDDVPAELSAWVYAMVEGQETVSWGADRVEPRQRAQSLYVVCEGAENLESIPEALVTATVIEYLV